MSDILTPESAVTLQKLIIEGNLPSRNQADDAARAHWSKGAKFKKEYTELVFWFIKIKHIKPIRGKALIRVTFYEKDEMRDVDNIIGGGLKYILDGLVTAGIIKNDSRKYVDLIITPIRTDRQFPRIEVELTGVLA